VIRGLTKRCEHFRRCLERGADPEEPVWLVGDDDDRLALDVVARVRREVHKTEPHAADPITPPVNGLPRA